MAKKKEKREEKDDYVLVDPKDIEEGVEYKMESWWDVFVRNYKNVPGFKMIVKFILYIFFFTILIIALRVTSKDANESKVEKTTQQTQISTPYKDMLNNLLNKQNSVITVKVNDTEYIINGEFGNSILTGTIESTNGLHNFKIKEKKTYEVKMGKEEVNDELFKDINLDIILNDSLVNIIKNSNGIKLENGFKYSGIKIKDTNYEIMVSVNDNSITGILLTSENISYDIKFVS